VAAASGRRAAIAAVGFIFSSRRRDDPGLSREEEHTMPDGTIKKLVQDRGFGFISAEDGKDYFFHRSGLDSAINFDSLTGGERVEFEIENSQKGPRAHRVRLS
jgi:cold shock protein